jgi:hypothetical protein
MAEATLRGAEEIVSADVRQSAITSHSIGLPEISRLIAAVPADSEPQAYERAAVNANVLGLATATGRRKRFKSLRRLYQLRPDSILFRALRDLWPVEEEARPLLAALCALANDSIFRASASVVLATHPGDEVSVGDFLSAVESAFPGAYAASTLRKVADNAYASWQQSGHLEPPEGGHKRRRRPTCRPADVAYALLLGHLQEQRGEALFETLWARVLDQPRSQLYELAFAASQRGMIEYRNAGGVVEVGFRELLRPLDGELL